MHRLTSQDDRLQLGGTMLLDPEQFIRAVTLTPGESYIYKEGLERPKHVFEPNFKDDFGIAEPPEDDVIKNMMEDFRTKNSAVFMPFIECGSYCTKCNPDYRLKAEVAIENYAKEVTRPEIRQASGSSSPAKFTGPYAAILYEFTESGRKCFCNHQLSKFLRKPQYLSDCSEPKLLMFCIYVHFLHKMGNLIKQAAKINECKKCHDSKRKVVFEEFWLTNSCKI